ncbi:hypothetical protein [Capnocytophaga canimorsus]|uniref:hypothetical protein n=1 Tax=Capnocytophaga canimorsus TaxID=28188 RepID=UPI001562133D|nr:hypothetical protein [Capnocytophaga canimorsus]
MKYLENTNEIIASSRIYLICKIKRKYFFFYNEPEVLYVGETFNKSKRFSTHKQLLKATTLLNQDERIFVYFLHMRFSYFGFTPFNNHIFSVFSGLKNLDNKESVRLLERVLIKLFLPPLNVHHKNDKPFKEDKLIQKKLIDNDIRYLHIDIGMEQKIFSFRGGNRKKNIDWYCFNIETGIQVEVASLFDK